MNDDDNKDDEEALLRLELRLHKGLQDGARKVVSELGGDVYSLLRLPLFRLRVRQLRLLATEVAQLREAMGVMEAKALPAKVQRLVVEEASVEEDPDLRTLWAQLIANQQAGMDVDAYLYEVLTKLTSQEAKLLEREARRSALYSGFFQDTRHARIEFENHGRPKLTMETWAEKQGLPVPPPVFKRDWKHPSKLIALGLLEPLYRTEKTTADQLDAGTDVDVSDYQITELAMALYKSACLPRPNVSDTAKA